MEMAFESPYFAQLAGGDYAAIIASAIDDGGSTFQSDDVPWIVAALAFVGRTFEAEGLFASESTKLIQVQRVIARFFIAVSLARAGEDGKARRLFLENHHEAKSSASAEARFFAKQGLAFYRYGQGRLHQAQTWTEYALKEASGCLFTYGVVLALELLGHVQLSSGQIHLGFRSLALARQRAASFGKGALLQAMDVSVTLYRSTYGMAKTSAELIAALDSALSTVKYEDSYTRASIGLERVRVLIMQGQLRKAKEQLEASSGLVYHIDNPALEMKYNLLLANLLRNQGESLQALSIVRTARQRAQQHTNSRALLCLLGFEAQLLQHLSRHAEHDLLLPEIQRLSLRCRCLIADRHLARLHHKPALSVRAGDDPLGDLIDQANYFAEASVPDILNTGWLSLLPLALGIKPKEQVLYLDAEPGALSLFNKGEVLHLGHGCTEFMRRLILTLIVGETSKETIAIKLWGKNYSPLRHDGLIYALVAKTRRLLGHAGHWIEACEIGYRLKPGVQVLARDLSGQQAWDVRPSHESAIKIGCDLPPLLTAQLNSRQIQVLNWIKGGEMIEPKMLMDRLQISDATASRDMGQLVALGIAERIGRGRATRYRIHSQVAEEIV